MSAWSARWLGNRKTQWRRYNPVQRVLAVLVAYAAIVLVIAAGLIASELIAKNLYITPTTAGNNLKNSVNDPSNQLLAQGAYLAKVGNCAACHTARGGAAFAGGKAIPTPFGTVFTSNITPDPAHGIGRWGADAFYRALHEGRSADGHLLTPAFPYPNYTHVTRTDSDALYAYFMHGVTPVAQPNKAHDLPFPYNTQIALAAWRLMFFDKGDAIKNDENSSKIIANNAINTPATAINEVKNTVKSPVLTENAAEQALRIERGAYLVRGLGHCSACHAERNALGASVNDQFLGGSLMPMRDWYAPSLMAADEASVKHWPVKDVVALLKTGIAPTASTVGPMAEVVAGSTQFWTDADLQATAAYLQSLPETTTVQSVAQSAKPAAKPLLFDRGEELFGQHCATCHGAQGQGARLDGNVALPALAGNRAVTMATTANLTRMILAGGYAPSTAGNPRPFGMPPFVHVLNDKDIAAVTTYIRNAWGNHAQSVSEAEIVQQRNGLMR